MSAPPESSGRCPACGATLEPAAERCWLCKAAAEPGAGAAAGEPAHAERRAAYQFSLSSLMLSVTLVAVLLSVFRISVGLGILLAILVAPAFLRTCVTAARKSTRGQPMTPLEKLDTLASSIVVVGTVGIAGGAAFGATCWVGFAGGAVVSSVWTEGYGQIGWGLLTGVPAGIAAGGYVGYRLIRRFSGGQAANSTEGKP